MARRSILIHEAAEIFERGDGWLRALDYDDRLIDEDGKVVGGSRTAGGLRQYNVDDLDNIADFLLRSGRLTGDSVGRYRRIKARIAALREYFQLMPGEDKEDE